MCVHMSSMPASCCALCNNKVNERVSGFAHREDEKPRLLKGRNRTEWVGIGESINNFSTHASRSAAADGSRNGSWSPKTEWGKEQSRRSVEEFRKEVEAIDQRLRLRSQLRGW